MDSQLLQKIQTLAHQLALEEQERLDAAETLVGLEQLAVEIGDKLASQLTPSELVSRSRTQHLRTFHQPTTSERASGNCAPTVSVTVNHGKPSDNENEPEKAKPTVSKPQSDQSIPGNVRIPSSSPGFLTR